MMKLCVGAASQRVVEEAAKLHVAQIIASRRQVGEFQPGYTGYTSKTLVETVKRLSDGRTRVVRDHGGPHQNGNKEDNYLAALDADLDAGFDVLHLDVCQLPKDQQVTKLQQLCHRYAGRIGIEVGGERDSQLRLNVLLDAALRECQPETAVGALGGRIWEDKQHGVIVSSDELYATEKMYDGVGVKMKAHNWDWIGGRNRHRYEHSGYYNIAPEFGNVEVDAWLRFVGGMDAQEMLNIGYRSHSWYRWYDGTVHTPWFNLARTGLRYCLRNAEVRKIMDLYDDREDDVRGAIRDAILCG